LEELIKITSFSKPDKILKILKDELIYDSSTINFNEVNCFKYGTEPIQLDMFHIGRRYVIDLKAEEKQVKIIFKSYFGISKTYFTNMFQEIINRIWKDVATRIIESTINTLVERGELKIGKCLITNKGIIISDILIPWIDLSYQKNYDRLTLNSKTNSKLWTNLYYLQDYNVDVLMVVLDWIFKENGLDELKIQSD